MNGICVFDMPFGCNWHDALVSKRCYKDAFSYERAYEIIEKDAGTHFDERLAELK